MRPDSFVSRLAATDFGTAFNFYRDGPGAELRCGRLSSYLEANAAAPVLLVGEAPGYRGARVSGIPFTSERQLTGTGPAEATATIVHREVSELGLGGLLLFWNVLPVHPHRPGTPESNRPPTRAEIALGLPFVAELATERIVAPVGRVAGEALGLPWIRHPSRGGARAFRAGLRELRRLLHSGGGGGIGRRARARG